MYCPSCGVNNGDFAARCRGCDLVLPLAAGRPTANIAPMWTSLTTFFAATTAVAALIALGLAFMVVQRGGLAEGPPVDESGPAPGAPGLMGRASAAPVAVGTVTLPIASAPTSLDVGQVASVEGWSFQVEKASFTPDSTANDWLRADLNVDFQNTGSQTARLSLPSTTSSSTAAVRTRYDGPSFFPMPSTRQQSPEVGTGLRLFLRDASGHEFGGGFGSGAVNYDLIAVPGDVLRLPFTFRYPKTSTGPFTAHIVVPGTPDAKTFDIRLDRQTAGPTNWKEQDRPLVLTADTWESVDGEWAVSLDGIDFDPGRGPGERPVTIHLRVKNLTDQPLPALVDRSDPLGFLRDFYIVDSTGNLAYSHADMLPTIVIPAQGTSAVAVQLFTTDLPSSSRPLVFTAILNWRTNCYLRFQIN